MNKPVARGSCLCGAVRFRAELPSKWVAHCHCTYCRRAHGAAFVTWAGFPSEQFAIEAGAEQVGWYESSPGAQRGFCSRCGSPMFFHSTRWPGEMHVARALFTDPLDREPAVMCSTTRTCRGRRWATICRRRARRNPSSRLRHAQRG